MFDFLFGGKKKMELIRELVEQRMMDEGYTDIEYKLRIKQMGNLELMSTPEANLVTIIQTALQMQKQGVLLVQILYSIEEHRKSLGHDSDKFQELMQITRNINSSGEGFGMYCKYRIDIETGGVMSDEQFMRAMEQAMPVLLQMAR